MTKANVQLGPNAAEAATAPNASKIATLFNEHLRVNSSTNEGL